MSRGTSLLLAALLVIVAALSVNPVGRADAHPLGNVSVNRLARLEVWPKEIRVAYVVDFAEIPALLELRLLDSDHDGIWTDEERSSYLAALGSDVRSALTLSLDGDTQELSVVGHQAERAEGVAGLDTLRIEVTFITAHSGERASLMFRDRNFEGRAGWQNVVVVDRSGGALIGDVESVDVTNGLRAYPDGAISPERADVSLEFAPGSTVIASSAEPAAGSSPLRASPSGWMRVEEAGLWVLLGSLLLAAGVGAFHALDPGHGKSLVAAYFAGTRGGIGQAVGLGLVVAATHSVGVIALGVLTIVASSYILPERLLPILQAVSGAMIVAIGATLVLPRAPLIARRMLALFGRGGPGDSTHSHGHGHSHEHPPAEPTAEPWRRLIALGLADGLMPTPSTLIVMLAAISVGRVAVGLALVVAFSVGFGAMLTTVAVAFLAGRRMLGRVSSDASGAPRRGFAMVQQWAAWLPAAAGLSMIAIGIWSAPHGITSVLSA